MNFNSLHFLIFLPIVLLLYWLLPHKLRWTLLLLASYYFYMSWNAWLVFAILGVTLVSYVAALLLGKTRRTGAKKALLAITIIICIGTLVFFKYFNFLIRSATDFLNLFGLNINSRSLDIILPVGISFYTFQTLSYVIDVYRGKFVAEKHFGYYALFVSYFPQLVAGPIERPGDLLPQLRAEHKLNIEDMSQGFKILLCGFFKKCVVADFCGVFVNNVFANLSQATGLSVFIAGALFYIQMYCDFSGYSEIAVGCAKMMGVNLTRNFDRPYLSVSYTEFFRRWHITLNRWFTDYLYVPLGGSRNGKVRKILNCLIVFALSGLWHGANWTFLLWGLYAAFFVCIEGLLRKPFGEFCENKNIDLNNAAIKLFRRSFMFLIFVPAAIIFRSETVSQIGAAFARISSVGLNATFEVMNIGFAEVLQLVLSISVMCFFDAVGEHKILQNTHFVAYNGCAERTEFIQRLSVYLYTVAAVALLWIALLASGDLSAFQYFQF